MLCSMFEPLIKITQNLLFKVGLKFKKDFFKKRHLALITIKKCIANLF